MKHRYSYLVAVVGSLSLSLNIQSVLADEQPGRQLAGWGVARDPSRDCGFFLGDGSLLISVPGSARPHDLAADIHVTNAPRVLQRVRGDFTIQVRVAGRFQPGDESTKAGRTAYNGAGIVAMVDEKNACTLARAALQDPGKEPKAYANFEIRVGGELERIGMTGDHPLPNERPVFLRLERRGSKFLGAVSTDGDSWDVLEPKKVPEAWPKELQVGVVAISTSKYDFDPRFSKLQVLK